MNSRVIIIALICLVSMTGAAQKSLFEDAIKAGRPKGQAYLMRNDKKKWLESKDVRKYAESKGYLLGSMDFEAYNRFGKPASTVYSVRFIPKSELTDFVYEAVSQNSPTSLSQLTQKGSAYHACKGLLDGIFPKYDGKHRCFTLCDHVAWSGQTSGGMIDGRGVGFAELGGGLYVWFEGTFDKGFPVGDIAYNFADNRQGTFISNPSNLRVLKFSVGRMSDGLASFKYLEKCGFTDGAGMVAVLPSYDSVEQDFKDGVAYVTTSGTAIRIDKEGRPIGLSDKKSYSLADLVALKKKMPEMESPITQDALRHVQKSDCTFEDLATVAKEFPSLQPQVQQMVATRYQRDADILQRNYDRTVATANELREDLSALNTAYDFAKKYNELFKYDPDNKMRLVNALESFRSVCFAMSLNPLTYYRTNYGYPEFDETGYSQMKKISAAQSVCNNSHSDFGAFYSHAASILREKYQTISEATESAKNRYNSEVQRLKQQLERELASINASNIHNYVDSHDSDWSKGRFRDTDANHVDHINYHFKNIDPRFKHTTFHAIIYESTTNGVREYYESEGRFKTFEDALVAAFLAHYSKSWHHNRID